MPGHSADQERLARQLAEWARRMSAAGSAFASESPAPGDDRGRPGPAERGGDGPINDLSEVPVLFMLSGLRLWARSAEVWARLGVAMVRGVGGAEPDAGQGDEARSSLLIDELRAALRELTTVSSQETRRLEAALEELGRRGRRDAPGDEPGPYWRRWEVKP
jgi:hypothetical protein